LRGGQPQWLLLGYVVQGGDLPAVASPPRGASQVGKRSIEEGRPPDPPVHLVPHQFGMIVSRG
jgi:hypothetical protein